MGTLTLLLSSHLGRGVLALPLLYLSYFCNKRFDRDTLVELVPPILEKGFIPHPSGPVPVLEGIFPWKPANDLFRPISVIFAPSTLSIDPLAWHQMLFFLVDLGPVYLVLLLESFRDGNAYTAAYLATAWNFAAQILGLGVLAPLYCWLHFTFSPSTSILALDPRKRLLKEEYIPFLLPLLVALHYAWVYHMFFPHNLDQRHYYTWLWQPAPLWIGLANTILAKTIPTGWAKGSKLVGKGALSLVVAGISMVVWWYVILHSGFSLWEVFVPVTMAKREFVISMRGLLQYDLLCSFGGLLVWSLGLMVDVWAAGAVGLGELIGGLVVVALAGVMGGPGVAMLDAWWWREKRLGRLAGGEQKGM
ncbi:hypothetical protein QC761_306360 [Podospora bellae-mahoneyi]|uniref:Uncharacterized protein n=1 Tax=Podospora bellae-mahoneyi TaxID=2093777 RepID=A0ABR0FMD3_9PEZI|nr:hypothetical protein QC761_306360 [Podospora bellae-mahoneyi]